MSDLRGRGGGPGAAPAASGSPAGTPPARAPAPRPVPVMGIGLFAGFPGPTTSATPTSPEGSQGGAAWGAWSAPAMHVHRPGMCDMEKWGRPVTCSTGSSGSLCPTARGVRRVCVGPAQTSLHSGTPNVRSEAGPGQPPDLLSFNRKVAAWGLFNDVGRSSRYKGDLQ